MSSNKTKPTDARFEDFINTVESEKKRKDSFELIEIFRQETQQEPVMWGESIIGFGQYTYDYKSGRKDTWCAVGFAPRKQNIALYMMTGARHHQEILSRLGKVKTGAACIYINKLEDIDVAVLRELIQESVAHAKMTYPNLDEG